MLHVDPGWTKYTVNGSCLYSTYDVTSLLKPGDNAFGVMLGNGMYLLRTTLLLYIIVYRSIPG